MIEQLRALLDAAAEEGIREERLFRRRRSPNKHLLVDITRREELKAAAVNALPALLDIAEAAREAVKDGDVPDPYRRTLREALVKLEAS